MNNNFLIESSDLELAKDLCKYIENPDVRNRAVANALAAGIATKFFEDIDVDVESGLHNIASVLNDIEISDIYVNGAYIDVRLYFNENELCVPKMHYDNGICPVAYMFIKLDEELSGGIVTGFVLPDTIDVSNYSNGYYFVNEEDLISYYDIEPLLYSTPLEDLPDNIESQIFDYLDGKVEDKANLYNILLHSKELRILLMNAAKTQNIFNFISQSDRTVDNIIEDDVIVSEVDTLDDFEEVEDIIENTVETFELIEENSAEDLNITELEEENLIDEYEPISDFSEELILEENETEELVEFEAQDDSDVESLNNSIDDEIIEAVDTEDVFETVEEQVEDALNLETYEPIEDFEDEGLDNESGLSNEMEFTTNVTPSLESIEERNVSDSDANLDEISQESVEQLDIAEVDVVEEIEESIENVEEAEYIEDVVEDISDTNEYIDGTITENEADLNVESSDSNSISEIDELFGESSEQEVSEETDELINQPSRKKSNILPIIGILAIVAAAGYYGYNKYNSNELPPKELTEPAQNIVKPNPVSNTTPIAKPNEAMPIETVENVTPIENNIEGTAVSIPAIEKNLDASILVSNLSVNWEVPSGYVNNSTAKRYFVKIGKIIQLNLKTELLLLNKPPITNKIAVELEFNKNRNQFGVKQVTISSGEKTIDDLIVQTIKKTLEMSLNANMSVFNNIQGNPILVIRL